MISIRLSHLIPIFSAVKWTSFLLRIWFQPIFGRLQESAHFKSLKEYSLDWCTFKLFRSSPLNHSSRLNKVKLSKKQKQLENGQQHWVQMYVSELSRPIIHLMTPPGLSCDPLGHNMSQLCGDFFFLLSIGLLHNNPCSAYQTQH